MGLPRRDHGLHTYGDYLFWPDDVRYELIDGAAYLMSPGPNRVHQELAGELHRQIANALVGTSCRPFIAPLDVRLPKNLEADDQVDTVVQPDVFVVCDHRKLDTRGIRGAPDWVIEILSPSTAGHDQTLKRRAYERAGVKELWFVHPTDRTVVVCLREDNGVFKSDVYEMTGTLSARSVSVCIDWSLMPTDP